MRNIFRIDTVEEGERRNLKRGILIPVREQGESIYLFSILCYRLHCYHLLYHIQIIFQCVNFRHSDLLISIPLKQRNPVIRIVGSRSDRRRHNQQMPRTVACIFLRISNRILIISAFENVGQQLLIFIQRKQHIRIHRKLRLIKALKADNIRKASARKILVQLLLHFIAGRIQIELYCQILIQLLSAPALPDTGFTGNRLLGKQSKCNLFPCTVIGRLPALRCTTRTACCCGAAVIRSTRRAGHSHSNTQKQCQSLFDFPHKYPPFPCVFTQINEPILYIRFPASSHISLLRRQS